MSEVIQTRTRLFVHAARLHAGETMSMGVTEVMAFIPMDDGCVDGGGVSAVVVTRSFAASSSVHDDNECLPPFASCDLSSPHPHQGYEPARDDRAARSLLLHRRTERLDELIFEIASTSNSPFMYLDWCPQDIFTSGFKDENISIQCSAS